MSNDKDFLFKTLSLTLILLFDKNKFMTHHFKLNPFSKCETCFDISQ